MGTHREIDCLLPRFFMGPFSLLNLPWARTEKPGANRETSRRPCRSARRRGTSAPMARPSTSTPTPRAPARRPVSIYLWAIANNFLQAVKQNKRNSSTHGQLQMIFPDLRFRALPRRAVGRAAGGSRGPDAGAPAVRDQRRCGVEGRLHPGHSHRIRRVCGGLGHGAALEHRRPELRWWPPKVRENHSQLPMSGWISFVLLHSLHKIIRNCP
eukprot:SAG31_NODE_1022_length_10309_cov_9.623874_7_plen_212_part_00